MTTPPARYVDQVAAAVLPLSALNQAIINDLDPEAGGISWWAHLDRARRILIGDYLIQLSDSTQLNLVEAVMHLELARHLWTEAGDELRTTGVRLTRRLTPAMEDRAVEESSHVVGFFRALGSVFDNLAGLTIGVAGLRVALLRAPYSHLRVTKNSPGGTLPECTAGRNEQIALHTAIKAALDKYPAGWDQWVIDMRNMLVHRARRMNWVYPDGRRTDLVMRPLPARPSSTDVEAMSGSGGHEHETLHESADTTMAGALDATVHLVQATASAAVHLWSRRRASPDLIVQPAEQWPKLTKGDGNCFVGWQPGTLPTDVKSIHLNPDTATRFAAAHLLDERRDQWQDQPRPT